MAPMKKPITHQGQEFAGTVSLDAAAQLLGVTRAEMRRRLGRGELPFVEVRGRIRVPKRVLEECVGR